MRPSARPPNRRLATSSAIHVRGWWNRQTREFEGLVVEIPCGFKSRPAHHLDLSAKCQLPARRSWSRRLGFTVPSGDREAIFGPQSIKKLAELVVVSARRIDLATVVVVDPRG